MDIINGYRINPYIFLGMGTGWRYYHEIEDALVPLFLNFRVNFIQSQMSPFLGLSTGYSLNASNNFKGARSEEHTSELQSRGHLVCRLLLEKKNSNSIYVV